jgi:hypothetical protein
LGEPGGRELAPDVAIRKIIRRPIRLARDGVDVVAGVNAAVAANVGERGGSTSVSSRQQIVQRSGQTVVSDSETSCEGPGSTSQRNEHA